MANSLVQPYNGDLAPDLQPLKGILIDALSGATRGLRREKPDIEKALFEIDQNIPGSASILGIAPSVRDHIADLTEKLALIREARARIKKLAEVLAETEAFVEDERENEIGHIVSSVRRAAIRKNPAVTSLFEQTIRYHGQIAARAHKTRRKNQQPADAPAPEATPPASSPQ
ncbi:MAG TPA: hypothetical protein VE093_03005 [Polyangiaceae bacterium]|jgi:hypothetical protein|nr:hypothetical protein [Polyangiaceae bacterium]